MSARIIPTTLGKGWRLPGVGPPTAFWSFDGALERDLPCSSDSKDSARHAGVLGLIPEVRKLPWRGEWQPTPASLPEESHGQRILADYSSWGLQESDAAQRLALRWNCHGASGGVSCTCSVASDSLQPMDCSPPGSSVHGILQARILEWVAIPSSRGSSQLRDQTQASRIAGGFFTL